MKKIKVSIIIPTLNRGFNIEKTILAIEKSEYPRENFEIIIVDDSSSVKNSNIIKSIIKNYPNIKYFKNKINLGPSATRNIGIKKARGNIIFFTDDDCIVSKNWIKDYVKFLEENKNVAGVGGCCTPSSKNLIGRYEEIKDKILKIRVKKQEIGGEEIPMGFTGNVAYRKKILDEFGGFNENLRRGEDVELKKRIAKKYFVAALPILVIHNHNYNIDYLLSSLIKEGLDQTPPKKKSEKVIILLKNFPYFIINSIKKLKNYRSKK